MPARSSTTVGWVHVTQALVAREGVERMGLSTRRMAELLGLAPSAISQYVTGRRVRAGFLANVAPAEASAIARKTVEALLEAEESGRGPMRPVLEAAAQLAELPRVRRGVESALREEDLTHDEIQDLDLWSRQRIRTEQAAVAQCMRLALRARDELTRSLFRQIASDSLRHAEIVASLSAYIDRGIPATYVSGISRREIQALIESERRAEEPSESGPGERLGGTMALLLASIEADERKHSAVLEQLLASGFRSRPAARGSRS